MSIPHENLCRLVAPALGLALVTGESRDDDDTLDSARRPVVSSKTVRNHLSSVFTKLQVADRVQAIVRARETGLGRAGDG